MEHLKGKFKMRFISLIILLFSTIFSQAYAEDHALNEDLLYRINFGSADDIKVLLAKGADPNTRTRQGETAFNVAMERNDAESERMATALVESGANLETPDKDGNLPIIVAVKYKLTGVVQLMLAKGANYHVNAPDGTTLIDYARKNGTKEMVDAIQALIGKEDAYNASFRTPERFHEIVRLYTMDSCTYQYWSYVIASRQSPERDIENQKKVDLAKARLLQLMSDTRKYYDANSANAMLRVSNDAVQQIYDQLDVMISNTNRSEQGIGRDQDAKSRCEKIISGLPINFTPVALPPPNPGTSSFTQSGSPAAAASSTHSSGTDMPH